MNRILRGGIQHKERLMSTEEKTWYFARGGKTYGPFTEHGLCKHYEAGKFASSDYVFCKGQMESWVKADTVPGLCDSLELDPEPEPEHHQVPQYERAAYDHALDKKRMKKEAKKKQKALWDKLKKRPG